MEKLRIAVIGCGAVAERVHLPALARSRFADAAVLVDTSADRASHLASAFGARAEVDYRSVIGSVDAAIVGVPHHLHASIASALLDASVPVLVEKPMALATSQCDAMIEASERSGAVLAVGLLRRCSPALQWVKQALEAGALGRIESFDLREGSVYSWPVASPSMFSPEGGGVLADAGAHVLDLVLWWFGQWRALSYRDDARGGVEADCLIELEMQNGVRGRIELSRTRTMRNTCVIRGAYGTIEVGTKTDAVVSLTWNGGPVLSGRPISDAMAPPKSLVDLFEPQLEQFVRAIKHGECPAVTGYEGRRSIELIEACYRTRQPWRLPWDAGHQAPATVAMEAAR
jgi:predicted dehydrogenase